MSGRASPKRHEPTAVSLVDVMDLNGEAIALSASGGQACSRADLAKVIKRAATVLRTFSSAHRGPIVTLLPDDPATLAFLVAAADSTQPVVLNPASSDSEIRTIIEETHAAGIATFSTDATRRDLIDEFGLGHIGLESKADSHIADFDLRIQPPTGPSRASESDTETPCLILTTSGSTGKPKIAPLPIGALCVSARTIAQTLKFDPDDHVVHSLPMFHIGAILDLFIVPLMTGQSVHFVHPISTEAIVQAIRHQRPTWIQAVPTMLAVLRNQLSSDELEDLGKSLRFIRSVSADLPGQLQADIEEMTNTPIVQMYGMTETAGQIASNGLAEDARRHGSVGRPPPGTVRILDEFGGSVAPGKTGEICVCADNVFGGYLNLDNADYFFGDWFRTGDVGYLNPDGFLFLAGRIKDIVNRGGEKIAALEIERLLLDRPDVREAAVFPIEHATLGEDVGAVVSLTDGAKPSSSDLTEYLAAKLSAHKVPRHVTVLSELPKLAGGKVDKMALRRTANQPDDILKEDTPLSALGEIIAQAWSRVLDSERPRQSDDFFDAGGDSLSAHTFILDIEAKLRVTLPANILFENPTFGEFEQAITKVLQSPGQQDATSQGTLTRSARAAISAWPGERATPTSLLTGLRVNEPKAPLFFCANSLDDYLPLARALDHERPFYAMRTLNLLPEKSVENTERLISIYADEVLALQPSGDIILGGHCEGASMARQIVDELLSRGRYVSHIVVIDRVFREVCAAPALIVWTANSDFSHHSGTAQFLVPERGIENLFPLGARIEKYDHHHNDLMVSDAVKDIAQLIDTHLANGKDALPIEIDAAIDAARNKLRQRQSMYQADISISAPRLFQRKERVSVSVTVTNTSNQTWHPTQKNHFVVVAKWQRASGKMYLDPAGHAELAKPVEPGESVRVEMMVQCPSHRSPLKLVVDMVDDGTAWFHWHGNRYATHWMIQRPF